MFTTLSHLRVHTESRSREDVNEGERKVGVSAESKCAKPSENEMEVVEAREEIGPGKEDEASERKRENEGVGEEGGTFPLIINV